MGGKVELVGVKLRLLAGGSCIFSDPSCYIRNGLEANFRTGGGGSAGSSVRPRSHDMS